MNEKQRRGSKLISGFEVLAFLILLKWEFQETSRSNRIKVLSRHWWMVSYIMSPALKFLSRRHRAAALKFVLLESWEDRGRKGNWGRARHSIRNVASVVALTGKDFKDISAGTWAHTLEKGGPLGCREWRLLLILEVTRGQLGSRLTQHPLYPASECCICVAPSSPMDSKIFYVTSFYLLLRISQDLTQISPSPRRFWKYEPLPCTWFRVLHAVVVQILAD